MMAFFEFLDAQPYVLLFSVVALAAAIGRVRLGGFALGTTASAILVGAGLAITSAGFGVELELDEFTKLFAYYLFMYAVGLRIGPSFVNSFDRDGVRFAFVAVLASVTGLLAAITMSRVLGLPAGMDVGLLAGALTESAAIGAAEGAVASGAAPIPEGMTAQQLSANAAVGYSLTYVFGSIGIILMVRLLPRIFRIDAAAAARAYEEQHQMADDGTVHFHPGGPTSMRAAEVLHADADGQPLAVFRSRFEGCRAVAHFRGEQALTIDETTRLEKGDILALVGPHERLIGYVQALGREVADPGFVKAEIDHAEVLVFRSEVVGRTVREVGGEHGFGLHLNALRRSGQARPWGPDTILRRGDVLDLTGDRQALERLTEVAGSRAQFGLATDLMTLGFGVLLGLLMGMLTINVAGIEFGLGSAASVLVAGVIIASLRERLPIFGNTPTAARQLLEDIGLTVFVAVIGVNAGSHMLDGVTLDLALKVLVGGVVVSTLPPLLTWVVGYYVLRINAAVLMGVVAGARVNTAPVKEATNDLKSSVPWVGYPIPYAVANVLDSFWGYFLMVIR
jgi:putative transport protein